MVKKSIRNDIEKLKEEANLFLSSKDLDPKLKFFIKSILMTLNIVVSVLLEKKVHKNSNNSGLPPSSDFGSNGNRNKPKKGEKQNLGSQLDNSRVEESEEVLSPKKCSNCNASLKHAEITDTEQRKTIDIEYVVIEKNLISETKKCSECQEETKAPFPNGVDGKVQYGMGIKAMAINFLIVQMISMQRIQEYFAGLIGRTLSPAVILKYVTQFSESLEEWEKDMTRQLLAAKVLYIDETSMRVGKELYWIHTYSFENIVLQFIHPKRGLEAISEIGILPRYGGIIVHDCWWPYFTFEEVVHALCNAHLMRDLKFIEESMEYRWATRLKRLLKAAIKMVNSRKKKILTKKQYARLERLYDEILMEALGELPGFPESTGKRGRPKHTDAQNLWLRLFDHKDAVLLFAKVAEVDPTNNKAERNLRMNKVKKKVSGCFRSKEMAKHFCRIYSYVKTMRNKGYSSLEAITFALKGEIPA